MSVRDDIVEAANMEIGGWSAVEYHPTVTDMDAYFMQAWGGPTPVPVKVQSPFGAASSRSMC